jgi:hypothetical protein
MSLIAVKIDAEMCKDRVSRFAATRQFRSSNVLRYTGSSSANQIARSYITAVRWVIRCSA